MKRQREKDGLFIVSRLNTLIGKDWAIISSNFTSFFFTRLNLVHKTRTNRLSFGDRRCIGPAVGHTMPNKISSYLSDRTRELKILNFWIILIFG